MERVNSPSRNSASRTAGKTRAGTPAVETARVRLPLPKELLWPAGMCHPRRPGALGVQGGRQDSDPQVPPLPGRKPASRRRTPGLESVPAAFRKKHHRPRPERRARRETRPGAMGACEPPWAGGTPSPGAARVRSPDRGGQEGRPRRGGGPSPGVGVRRAWNRWRGLTC